MTQPSDTEVVADLAEDFVELHRQGQRPSIDDFVKRYPHLAEEIRELFPTLLVVENLAPEHDASVAGDDGETLLPPVSIESLGELRRIKNEDHSDETETGEGDAQVEADALVKSQLAHTLLQGELGQHALQYAHEHSIIHRDIKPSNLMLDDSGTVWVTDFGLAKALDQQDFTHTGDILGTLRYMPPEAFTSKTDHRGDIYSLGITIYEMLALRPAFDAPDRHRLIAKVAEGGPDRLEQADPGIPRDLVTIVHKAIERDPAHRYQTAKEMAEDLARFVEDEPIKARRVSSIERLVRWSRRNLAMTAALAAIATLLVIGMVGSTIFALRFREQRNLAEYAQYVSDIQAANFHLEKNSTAMAQRILGNIPAKYRDWEWAFLANMAWRHYATQEHPSTAESSGVSAADFWRRGEPGKYQEIVGTSGGIPEAQFTHDGTQVVLASHDNALTFYSVASGQKQIRLENPMNGAEMSIGAINPEGTKLVTAALTGLPMIFDLLNSKRLPQTIPSKRQTMSAAMDWAWSPDGKYFVSSHFDKRVRIWDAQSLQRLPTLPEQQEEVRNLYFDSSGQILWTAAADGTISKWSFPDSGGKPIRQWSYPETELLSFLAISPDRSRVVATFQDDSSFIWEIGSDQPVSLRKAASESQTTNSNRRRAAIFSPDGSCVAVMRGLLSVAIYDTDTHQQISLIDGHSSPLRSIRFSPDGTKLLTTSEDATAIIWTPQDIPVQGHAPLAAAHSDAVYQIDFDTSGKKLLSGSFDGTVCVSDLESQHMIQRYKGHETDIVAVDFHSDGTRAASLDRQGELHVWNVSSGSRIFEIHPQSPLFHQLMGTTGGGRRGEFFSFPSVLSTGLFSPDGECLVAFQRNGMKVFDAENGALHVPLEDANNPGWAVFSHDSQLVSVIEMDGPENVSMCWKGTRATRRAVVFHPTAGWS